MKLISIDPAWAKPMAYALFENEVLEECGKTEVIGGLIIRAGPDVIVTERPYLGGNAKKYSQRGVSRTFETLCYAVGIVAAFAGYVGAEFHLVRPVDWKSSIGLTKRNPPAIHESIRAELMQYSDNEDVQDAIMIGQYYLKNFAVKEGAWNR
ncbi:MAG: hypothetical protein JRK26_27290 [Deltaproteobacteria bacterium]|nr:hypothetical protein [Deltaproteobacteria bacterium]